MPFSASIPDIPAMNSAAVKKSPDELRSYAAGIMAHIAIQTMYRLDHPGNYIISERGVWVGDAKASTISKILDNIDRLVDLGRAVAKAAAKGPKPKLTGTTWENLCVALAYLIDISTVEGAAGKVVRKRYDIVDFGPIVISLASKERFGEAYEIKSKSGLKNGREYITQQVDNYNQTLGRMKKLLEESMEISGLLSGYRLRLGRSWPRSPQLWILGPNILSFWLEEPGVILYEWLSFRRMSWKQLWEFVKKVQKDIRSAFETRSSLKPEVVVMLVMLAVIAAFIFGLLALGMGIALGGGAIPVGTALARLAQTGALTSGLAGVSAAATPSTPQPVPNGSEAEAAKVNEVLAALGKMEEPDLSFLAQSYRPSTSSQEGLPGGTPQTPYEQALFKMVDTLVSETVFLYSVQIGQGDELLNEYSLGILKENLVLLVQSFISAYGLENFLMLTGQTRSAELDEATALKIAEMIVAAARGNLESTAFGRFLADFFSLSIEDVDESLPRGYNEDGE